MSIRKDRKSNLPQIGVCFVFPMRQWLQSFPFKTDIEPWVFVAACALTLVICWLTVIYQSVKAALANPVTSLRSE